MKVDAPLERYQVMAEMGLTPPLLACGQLESGSSIIVQPLIPGHNPSKREYGGQLEKVAALIHKMHHDARLTGAEPKGINSEGLKRRDFDATQIANIKNAYRLLYRSGLKLAEASAQLKTLAASQPELTPFVDFLSTSERSIIR